MKKGALQLIKHNCKESLKDYYRLHNLKEIDNFLDISNLLRMNHEDIQNLKRPITSKDVESVKKKSLIKSLELNGFTEEFYQTLKGELRPIPQTFQKIKEKCILSNLCDQNSFCTSIQGHYQKKTLQAHISMMNTDTKILNKILVNQI
jgi:hypothetical protein